MAKSVATVRLEPDETRRLRDHAAGFADVAAAARAFDVDERTLAKVLGGFAVHRMTANHIRARLAALETSR